MNTRSDEVLPAQKAEELELLRTYRARKEAESKTARASFEGSGIGGGAPSGIGGPASSVPSGLENKYKFDEGSPIKTAKAHLNMDGDDVEMKDADSPDVRDDSEVRGGCRGGDQEKTEDDDDIDIDLANARKPFDSSLTVAVRNHVQERRRSLDGPPPGSGVGGGSDEEDDDDEDDEMRGIKKEKDEPESVTLNALQLRGVIFPQKIRMLLENAVANERYNVRLQTKNASMLLNNVEHGIIEQISYFDDKWDVKMFQLAQTEGKM